MNQVSQYTALVPSLIRYFEGKVSQSYAGQLSCYLHEWKSLTSDPEILETVSGQLIEFEQCPAQLTKPLQLQWSNTESQFIDSEIEILLQKGVIRPSTNEPGQFISPIFLRPKKDGHFRMILNLKRLNQSVKYHHFKMDTIWSAVRMMRPGCYMASIDLKDAYYSVKIHPEHQKYLKFYWRGKLYQYTCFPNGLAPCPRKFTKLLKPIFSTLRNKGHMSVIFIDDSFLIGFNFAQCVQNLIDTLTLLDRVGFVVHPEKSVLQPTQKLVFLGFVLDSINMTITLTCEKAAKIKDACQTLMNSSKPLIREVARVLGLLTSSFPGVMYGPLHYRWLDMNKTKALKENKGNFDRPMTWSPQAQKDLTWWARNIEHCYNVISHHQPTATMSTDASKIGWGCSFGKITTGGTWSVEESQRHINWLETKAIAFAIQCFLSELKHKHVKILTDNTTAMSCLNQMGTSHSEELNMLVADIWQLCIDNDIWLTVAHIPGKDNTLADLESRKTRRDIEWSLSQAVFDQAIRKLNITPTIDLFASRLNFKCKTYISFTPDPGAYSINAFHISWKDLTFYAFPPFCIIQRVLQKITEEEATGILVAPYWPTQSWWPYLTNMLINFPILLPRKRNTLTLPSNPQHPHPLHHTLQLLMCHLSGDTCKSKEFQQELQMSLSKHGDLEQESNTNPTYLDGNGTVINGVLIHFVRL